MGLDLYSGVAHVFRAKRGDRIKVLWFDGAGLVLAYKRLEQGRFAWPAVHDGVMRLSRAQFEALFEGLDWRWVWSPRVRKPRTAPVPWPPARRTVRSRHGRERVELDLQLAGEAVSNKAGEHLQLVADPGLDRDVIHLAMRLEFGEDTLLRTAAFVDGDDPARAYSFVGEDDLEFAPVFCGLEQVGLYRQFVLASDLLSDEDEAIASVP